DLAGARDRQREFQAVERAACAGGRALGQVGNRRQIAAGLLQPLPEVIRSLGIGLLQIDYLVAFDDAQTQSRLCFKTDDFHDFSQAPSARVEWRGDYIEVIWGNPPAPTMRLLRENRGCRAHLSFRTSACTPK